MKRLFLMVIMIGLFSLQLLAQEDYKLYLDNAYSALKEGRIDHAKKCYNIYVTMTGKVDKEFADKYSYYVDSTHVLVNMDWAQKAAEQGHAGSMDMLGQCFEYGHTGFEKDYSEALNWYSKAAYLGYAHSQFKLGLFYEYGIGDLDVNTEEAKKWYDKAAKQNYELAVLALELLNNKKPYWIESVGEKADHFKYPLFKDLSSSQINAWVSKYSRSCRYRLTGFDDTNTVRIGGYTITGEMLKDDPCLAYLVYNCKSLDYSSKSEIFQKYNAMKKDKTKDRIEGFYKILLPEFGWQAKYYHMTQIINVSTIKRYIFDSLE